MMYWLLVYWYIGILVCWCIEMLRTRRFRRLSFVVCRLMEAAKPHPDSLTAHRSLLTFSRSEK